MEVFQAAPAAQSIARESVVALVPRPWADPINAPLLGTLEGLCSGERFAEEPAAAFCTGILVDWDLVLTAGHCAHLFALDEFVVPFDYYYSAPGVLALDGETRNPVEVVSEELDPEGADPRLDCAWIRLDSPVLGPRKPVAVYRRPPPLTLGEPLLSIGASGGTPLKVDVGGTVRDLRSSSLDYFIADTDTSEGGSGGGAFDPQGSLLGILARGGVDYVASASGCRVTNDQPDLAAQEQFTYVSRAVDGLCSGGTTVSSLCRTDCDEPCTASPLPVEFRARGGCRAAPAQPGPFSLGMSASVVAALVGRRLRRDRSKSKAPCRLLRRSGRNTAFHATRRWS